jgi:hypothetical protein
VGHVRAADDSESPRGVSHTTQRGCVRYETAAYCHVSHRLHLSVGMAVMVEGAAAVVVGLQATLSPTSRDAAASCGVPREPSAS